MNKPQYPAARELPAGTNTAESVEEFPANYCPVCSTLLESQRCKMICKRCGYFMSCSEFE